MQRVCSEKVRRNKALLSDEQLCACTASTGTFHLHNFDI